MDIDQDNSDMEGAEKLVDSEEKKNLECTPKIIIIIVIANCVFVAVNIILIRFFSLSKTDHMTTIMNDYIKDYTKSAITENRILHLVKSNNNSNASIRYQELVELQKLVFNATYDFLNSTKKFKTLLDKMNDITFTHLLGSSFERGSINIIENFYKVLTQKEDWRIYQLMDSSDLKAINDAIHKGQGDTYKEQLKIVILYGLINLPFQVFYFSKNETTRKDFQEAIINKLKDNITQIINPSMQKLDSTDKILMALGCDQVEEINRINANFSGYNTPINFIDVGLRTDFAETELTEEKLEENLGYYINDNYKTLMKDCSAKDLDDKNFTNFTAQLKEIINKENLYIEKVEEIQALFRKFDFSVETANTVINYIKLIEDHEKIKIIRLGRKHRNNEDKFNNESIFILYNVADILPSGDSNTTRSTTYSNAKAIKYLKEEYENFLTDNEYNNIVLVSTRGDAERQLEAFNLASNLSSIKDEKNQTMKWNQVVWNTFNQTDLEKNKLIEITLEAMVKSYNLIATNYFESHNKDTLYNLSCAYTDLIKAHQNI